MAWPFQRGGKSSGNRKHSKIDKLPPEMKATAYLDKKAQAAP